jgi:hypothetical protein
VRKLAVLAVFVAAGCASTPSVDLEEPRRVVGTEERVRIDAQIFGDVLSQTSSIRMTYDITNERATPIAVADLIPEAAYDPETQTVTVTIGSEVPGAQLLPRLVSIGPGEKKNFSAVARVTILMGSAATPLTRFPNALRLKVNFLNDTEPFRQLIGIQERAVMSPTLADELFPKWLEKNETLYTNTVPMRWRGTAPDDMMGGRTRRPPRRG